MSLTPTEAIYALDFPPPVTAMALGLLEGWMQRFAAVDSAQQTLLVETPFIVEIDEHALLVGIADRIAWSEAAGSVFGCSWKTTREAKGQWWNERLWLEEHRRAPQWKFETLGLTHGVWATPDGLRRFNLSKRPPFLLRGAVKSTFPTFWPERAEDGIFEMADAEEVSVRGALRVRVAAIRTMRDEALPWQLPGTHCITYNQKCEFLAQCEKGETFVPAYEGPPNAHDETIRAATRAFRPGFGEHADDVILTPTNYMLGSSCIERWRRRLLHPTPSSLAMQVGSAFHAGVAAWYTQDLPIATGKDLERWLLKA